MKIQFRNTLEKGSFRRIIFKEDNIWYAVALELNIVVSAETPQNALLDLYDTVEGYLEAVKKSKSRPFALNQAPEKEYEIMWKSLNSTSSKVNSPYTVFDFGVSNIHAK